MNHVHDTETTKVAAMAIIGALGGMVRICSSDKPLSVKAMAGSLMTSMFAAGITGALLHEQIPDPIYLSAVTGMAGYSGTVVLAILSKLFEDKIKVWFK